MHIAYTIAPGKGDTDLMLQQVAAALKAGGLDVCGTVQVNTETCANGPCDMDVQVLPNGPTLRISQSLGKASRGCRLDPAALEEAVGLVQAELAHDPDILIVNKFGKHEADGRGFRPVMAEAISQGIPVIVGANAMNVSSLLEFVESAAVALPPSVSQIVEWAQSVGRQRQQLLQANA